MWQWEKITVAFVAIIVSFFSYAQQVTQPSIKNFKSKDYGGHVQSFAIAQDTLGLIYVANVGGLLRYDGTHWTKVGIGKNNMAMSVDINTSGEVFVGGNGDFGKLEIAETGKQEFQSFLNLLPDSLRDIGPVWRTHCIGNTTYFNALKFIVAFSNGKATLIMPKKEFHLSSKVGDEIWVSEKNYGLFRIKNKDLKFIPNSQFFIQKSVYSILPYNKEYKLAVTDKSGIYLFSSKRGTSKAIIPLNELLTKRLANSEIYGGIELKNGDYAFNTLVDGVYIVSKEGAIIKHLSRAEGLQNEVAINIFQDAYNQLWCALDNGISLVSLNSPIEFAREGATYNGSVQSIIKFDSSVFVATAIGLYRYNTDILDTAEIMYTNPTISRKIQPISGYTNDLLAVGEDLLIGGNGLWTYNKNNYQTIANRQIRTLHKVSAYAHKVVLAAGTDGISVLKQKNGAWKETLFLTTPDEVRAIAQDFDYLSVSTDSLVFWFGTQTKGAFRVSFNNDFTNYSLQTFVKQQYMEQTDVLVFNHKGSVRFAYNNGTYVYDMQSQTFREDESEFGKAISTLGGQLSRVKETQNKRVWVATLKGLFYLTPEKDGTYSITDAGYMDIGNINCIYPENAMVCWAGGDQALARYNSQVQKEFSNTFYCLLQHIQIQGKDTLAGYVQEQGKTIQLSFKQNSLSFYFTSTFFEYSDEIKYSTMLEGYENTFTPWTNENKITYPNLQEGSYTFMVKAKNAYGKESEVTRFSFVISPPWYRTWWAYLLYVLLLVAGVYLIVLFNQRRLLLEKERLEKIISDRTKEVQQKNQMLEEKNKDITDSIMYAEKIQRTLLAHDELFEKFLPQHFIYYRPKDILSGDFYWMHAISGSEIIYATVDCTGHGVPGALMSIIGSTFLNEIVVQAGVTEPNRVLNMLRLQVIKSLGQSEGKGETRDGMDMTLCKLDLKNLTMEFSGANNPVCIVRNGEMMEHKTSKQPVGYHIGLFKPFKKHEVQLQKGDMIYTFSDGYADQFDRENKEKYKITRFRELLTSIADQDMDMQKQTLISAFEEWKGDTGQIDDVCVVGVRV